MKLLHKSFDLDFLKSEFNEISFELFTTENQFINCITCLCDSANEVMSDWKGIQSLISAYFKPKKEFSKWNVYLVIFCKEKIPIRDKYIIQNDKYAVRKIVIDGVNETLDINEITKSINEELLCLDLSTEQKNYTKSQKNDPLLYDLVKGTPLDKSDNSKYQRESIIKKLIEHFNEN